MLKKIVPLLLFFPIVVFAYANPGIPSGFVNDFAGVLNSDQKTALEAKLSQFEKNFGNEISVALIKELGGDTIENYATSLFADWGIGKKDKDNGVLLLIAIDDRRMRIEVGYGLEGALTDLQSNSIINETLKPAFQQGDFYGGIDKAVDDIAAATRGEYAPVESSSMQFNWNHYFDYYANVLIVLVASIIWITSVLARSKSWWAGGVIGGIIGIIISSIFGLFFIGLLSLILFIPLGLLLDFFVSRAYQRGSQTGHYPWWIGGPPGSGGGWGGGGFGGFGGGRSGGGGSSGSW